jgi:SOS response regulatory protein OraA/RecX
MARSRWSLRVSKSDRLPARGDPAAWAWERAVRLLARHDRSEFEIRGRLAMLEVSPALVEATIGRLQELRYLDDRRFAVAAAERAAQRGHGSEYVRAQLTTKGIDETLIDDSIAATFHNEEQLGRRVLARRYPKAPTRPAERAKAARFLFQRGFPEAVVLAILGEGC